MVPIFLRRLFSQKPKFATDAMASFCPKNEPLLEYLRGSKERIELEAALIKMSSQCPDIPVCIGNEKFSAHVKQIQSMPHCHGNAIASFSYGTREHLNMAILQAINCQKEWTEVSMEEKHKIWYKAADLIAGKYRQTLNASIMLGQAKTAIQAEIDTVELIDFLRFGADFLLQLAKFTPISPMPEVSLNTYHLRPLDGFIAAITPFNFTAIGGNLAFTPTLVGNCTVWKPSDTAILSNWIVYQIMIEAGLPPGVVSFIPAQPIEFGDVITKSPSFAGINFTGSAATFRKIWTMISNNLYNYSTFPRMVGECGGKNYHFVHPSADVESVVNATIRSAYEYSGQKCSACSRVYIPESLWDKTRELLVEGLRMIKVGDVCDFSVFTSAVIDEKAFDRISERILSVKSNPALELIAGGGFSKAEGYYINPTIVKSTDPNDSLMTEEVFGPLCTVYVYKDSEAMETLKLVDKSSYALTGSVFATNKDFIRTAVSMLRMSAGNFYINDKSTGSVVGQQPFGGSRLSGTNDKAGSPHFLLRWASPQVIKETFVPLREIDYPYMK